MIAEANMKKKAAKAKPEYKVDIWRKDPTGDELREMAEITENFEENGIKVDPEMIRRAVVNENVPKYMTLIQKDLKEDLEQQKELEYF